MQCGARGKRLLLLFSAGVDETIALVSVRETSFYTRYLVPVYIRTGKTLSVSAQRLFHEHTAQTHPRETTDSTHRAQRYLNYRFRAKSVLLISTAA